MRPAAIVPGLPSPAFSAFVPPAICWN
ncbi:MAG: hypothetical protein RIS69_1555, partial [Actinomycetota bacterium]